MFLAGNTESLTGFGPDRRTQRRRPRVRGPLDYGLILHTSHVTRASIGGQLLVTGTVHGRLRGLFLMRLVNDKNCQLRRQP